MVIHQNVVIWDQLYKNHKGSLFAMQLNFASIAKISLADSCHGRVRGINKICIPKFLLLP